MTDKQQKQFTNAIKNAFKLVDDSEILPLTSRMLWKFYCALMDEGFTETQATRLVEVHGGQMVQSATGLK